MWGRRRLFALARVLPLCDKVEVRLFGSGMPSVWIAHLGEMRFVLALSGWTANDWTGGGNLQLLRSVARPDAGVTSRVARHLESARLASVGDLVSVAGTGGEGVLASLFQLSTEGQVVYDFAADRFRYRPILSVALSEAVLGPENPELAAGKRMASSNEVRIEREEPLTNGRRLFVFKAKETTCEVIVDPDLAFTKAKCSCSYFYKNGLRAGPCRHLIALRLQVLTAGPAVVVTAPSAAASAPGAGPASGASAQAFLSPRRRRRPPRDGPQREEVLSLLHDVAREMRAAASRADTGLSRGAARSVGLRLRAAPLLQELERSARPGPREPHRRDPAPDRDLPGAAGLSSSTWRCCARSRASRRRSARAPPPW